MAAGGACRSRRCRMPGALAEARCQTTLAPGGRLATLHAARQCAPRESRPLRVESQRPDAILTKPRVKHFLQDRTLVNRRRHFRAGCMALLLAVRFAAPEPVRFEPADPGLEVILVNAKHDKKPLKADALAQANLDGGGNADAGRAKSPLPDLRRSPRTATASRRRSAAWPNWKQQQKVLAQTAKKTRIPPRRKTTTQESSPDPAPPTPAAPDDTENSRATARAPKPRSPAQIEDYNKRPRKTQITPSTREVGYAMYYKAAAEADREHRHAQLPAAERQASCMASWSIYIPVFQDGTIYEKEGGPRVERSSGNPALDEAALRIVRRAAPFGRFPENMRTHRQGRRLGNHHPLQVHPRRRGADRTARRKQLMADRYARDRQPGGAQQVAGNPCALCAADRRAIMLRAPAGAAGRLRRRPWPRFIDAGGQRRQRHRAVQAARRHALATELIGRAQAAGAVNTLSFADGVDLWRQHRRRRPGGRHRA